MIGLKLPRVQQPQGPVEIDWSNPITRKLVFALNPGAGISNLVTNTAAINYRNITLGVTKEGINSATGESEYNLTPSVSNGITLFTIMRARPSGYLFADEEKFILSTRNATNNGWSWSRVGAITGTDQGNLTRQGFTIQGQAAYSETNSKIPSNVDTPVAVRYNSTTGVISWFTFGVKSSPDTAGTTSIIAGGTLIYRQQGVFSSEFGKYIDRLNNTLVFERALSDQEIYSLSSNNWQIFKPIERPIYVGYQAPVSNKPLYVNKPRIIQTPVNNSPINWSNPITNGLAIAQFGGNDLLNNAPITLGTLGLKPSQYGLGIKGIAVSELGSKLRAHRYLTSNGAYTGDFTVMQFCAPVSSAIVQVGFAYGNIDGGFNFSGLAYNCNLLLQSEGGSAAGKFVHYTYNGGFNGNNPEVNGACDGKPHAFHAVRTNGQISGGRDGVSTTGDVASTRALAQGNNSQIYIGGGHSTGLAFIDSSIPITLAFNRGLSPRELLSLANDPFQVLADQKQMIWVSIGGVLQLVPILSLANVTNITTNTVKPQITLTY